MATILITGGTGLVGKALGQALLGKGYTVIILSRQAGKKSAVANLSYAAWDVEKKTIDEDAISSADYRPGWPAPLSRGHETQLPL